MVEMRKKSELPTTWSTPRGFFFENLEYGGYLMVLCNESGNNYQKLFFPAWNRVLFFGDRAASVPLEQFSQPNYRLSQKCSPGTDLSLLNEDEVTESPTNVIEAVLRYRNVVDAEVGKSYTKRLRHKFSRGSLAKRSFRYLVKPKPYTVA
uniref:Uncharacterized protein n=1 Tax=Caenorhabditis japonica TaxID=281687 RepID=A0A8R1I6V6_CAEJA